ncbi:hypothetical protein CHS0354_033661 [Potamilus streckersoni]|uniref:glutathione gamma-glutamylcysteinyltransferase n=1 Tax=Potamilus streckersoni TaxID=2493646 RepID=A0AAE0VMP1_9BIVA|nr:hypothetical protein CHS0354_033661 [Potamilus streckersoni]
MLRLVEGRLQRLFGDIILSRNNKNRYRQTVSMAVAKPPTASTQYYRRSLPETCIGFCSKEGKILFKQAMNQGYMDCYFNLAAQFRTQDEPAYCGLTSLVMILNALAVDPGKIWKGPWRWYHENMLDCCAPLALVQDQGITYDQFVCLAKCNSLDAKTFYIDDSTPVETFREAVKHYSQRDDSFMVVSYSRIALGQTGDGHFSPVGGYHPEKDMVLILDVARFKYPPHWVSLPLLLESMKIKDKATGKPRGYVILSKEKSTKSLSLFRLSDAFSVSNVLTDDISKFVDGWHKWVSKPMSGFDESQDGQRNGDIHKETVVAQSVQYLLELGSQMTQNSTILTTQVDVKCMPDDSDGHACTCIGLLDELERLKLHEIVSGVIEKMTQSNKPLLSFLPSLGQAAISHIKNISKCCADKMMCDLQQRLNASVFISMILLAWPYSHCCGSQNGGTIGEELEQFFKDIPQGVLSNEAVVLRRQITMSLSGKAWTETK